MRWTSLVICVLMGQLLLAQQSIVDSVHNLSAAGPGSVRATSEQQVCIFCHTPHNATPVQPLWNRQLPAAAYKVYSSNSLKASPGQPTGNSKLCLSCHDGTIALGNVVSRHQPIMMAGGITTLPPGKSNLGTDLSDDHPISFRYDSALVSKNPKLKSPAALHSSVRLDHNQELQCTTCHDAHDNQFGKFLVMANEQSQLCNSCHLMGTTGIDEHRNCSDCHKPHSAPSGPYLLKATTVSNTCTSCHGPQVSPTQGKNIAADLQKLSPHDTASAVNLANHVPDNVNCRDCHEPHTMDRGTAVAPNIPPTLGKIDGVNSAGLQVSRAQYGYEVCFKCHADNATEKVTLPSRQVVERNVRLQFAESAISYHPVIAEGRNSNVPSLIPPMNERSIIGCTDCHSSDTSVAAGSGGPNGPHGSNNRPLLIAPYETSPGTSESAAAYALCYRCHDRNSILNNQSFPGHRQHIVDQRTSCATCHDAHGIPITGGTHSGNAHLINFDLTSVQALPEKPISYDADTGTCTLSCHGKVHDGLAY